MESGKISPWEGEARRPKTSTAVFFINSGLAVVRRKVRCRGEGLGGSGPGRKTSLAPGMLTKASGKNSVVKTEELSSERAVAVRTQWCGHAILSRVMLVSAKQMRDSLPNVGTDTPDAGSGSTGGWPAFLPQTGGLVDKGITSHPYPRAIPVKPTSCGLKTV